MKFLMIVLLIAVIAVIAGSRGPLTRGSADALAGRLDPDAIDRGPPDETVIAPHAATSPSRRHVLEPPEPVAQPHPAARVVAQTAPPMEPEPTVEPLPEPDPIVEPDPPMEPEPIIEPDPAAGPSPSPIIEPDTAGVGAPHGDPLTADPDEPTDPPQAVIDAGEMPAQDLDPHAGWETDDDRTIHADPESGLYHTPDSPGYKLGPDGQVFDSEEEAQSAGFTRWDQPN